MQPVLLITSQIPGILWINGHPAGEVETDRPAVRPVAPQGAVYLQLFPMLSGYLPVSRRMTLSGGQLLPGSVESEEGIWIISWPQNVIEIELVPEKIMSAPDVPFSPLSLPGASAQEDGTVRVTEPLEDVVGHMRLNSYRMRDGVWQIVHSEFLWQQGAPRWPVTSGDAALAMGQACLLGLKDEARGYMMPGTALPDLQNASACLPMRCPAADGRDAVGLIFPTPGKPHIAVVRPMYYHAQPAGGMQGTWRIDGVWVE